MKKLLPLLVLPPLLAACASQPTVKAKPTPVVEYFATGVGVYSNASVEYVKGGWSTKVKSEHVTTPWSTGASLAKGSTPSLSVTRAGEGSVACRIRIDGKDVTSDVQVGFYAVAVCVSPVKV